MADFPLYFKGNFKRRWEMKKKWLLIIGLAAAVFPIITLSGCMFGAPRPGGLGLANVPSPLQVNWGGQQVGIWVSGEGKVTAVPDIATLSLGIEAQEATVAEAQTQASEAMDKVRTALKDNGVAEKDIQTQNFSIQKVTKWDEEKQQEIVIGYKVTNTVTAKIRDIDKAGPIIDAVVVAGGDLTRVDNISFSIDDPSAYLEQAREKAMADAGAKAKQLASLAGVRLGKPTYISESSYVPSPISRVSYEGGAAAPVPAPAAPPISPGEMEITANVQITYAIVE
jgi:uncharacterized protein YggE